MIILFLLALLVMFPAISYMVVDTFIEVRRHYRDQGKFNPGDLVMLASLSLFAGAVVLLFVNTLVTQFRGEP